MLLGHWRIRHLRTDRTELRRHFPDQLPKERPAADQPPECGPGCLIAAVATTPGYALHIDLITQTIREPGDVATSFPFDTTERERLLGGHDEIKTTMMDWVAIGDYEARRRQTEPWLFEAPASS